jgi:hypothetical protein
MYMGNMVNETSLVVEDVDVILRANAKSSFTRVVTI